MSADGGVSTNPLAEEASAKVHELPAELLRTGGDPIPVDYLMRNSGRVLTRGQLIERVWGSDYVGDTKTLDVHIKRLRSKIEPDPSHPHHLVTVRGLGYKFED